MEALVNSPLEFSVFVPQGGWFAVIDIANAKFDISKFLENDPELEKVVNSTPRDI